MDPTTLVTFLFRAPVEARTVELFGSWDNFDQPYRMHNDRRRGIWSGIFRFENITFDGDGLRVTKPRSGGLRQGATYWYYYRIDHYDDTYDDRQPCTASCPLIPGQAVNILEVPIEMVELPARCCSSSNIEGSLSNWQQMHSLDPATKYAMLDPTPVSKTHARSLSDGTLKGRLENQPLSLVAETISQPSTSYSECPGPVSAQINDSRDIVSRGSSVYSRDTSCSAADENHPNVANGLAHDKVAEPALFRIPEVVEVSTPSTVDSFKVAVSKLDRVDECAGHTETSKTEVQPGLLDVNTSSPTRKISALSIGPISVQNVQFYNESRPGTSLNEDPEQHRPRVYSLPNTEVRTSEEASPRVSPMTTALHLPAASSHDQDDGPTPDSEEIPEIDMGSPSFSAATASSDGEESPLHLSPRNSIRRNMSSTSRSGGGALTGFANRIRSIRARQHPPNLPREVEQTSTQLSPPSFMNYLLPGAIESNHSLAKTMSHPSHTRSAHEHMATPTVFSDEIPLPSLFTEEDEGSMADAIFSELGYLGASIG